MDIPLQSAESWLSPHKITMRVTLRSPMFGRIVPGVPHLSAAEPMTGSLAIFSDMTGVAIPADGISPKRVDV